MTKSDLKNRMVVELRNGTRYVVIDNYLTNWFSSSYLQFYNDKLLSYRKKDETIIKVYDKIEYFEELQETEILEKKLLWQRSEFKEITIEDIEKKFGCKVKIVKEK
jgi:hypothetical protein